MNFTYEASGKLCHCGWASTAYTKRYATKFSPRDLAWIRRSASRGVLESVAIKVIESRTGVDTGGQPSYLYIDTYNAYWREDMLLSHAEAVSLAADYYMARLLEATDALREDNSCLS